MSGMNEVVMLAREMGVKEATIEKCLAKGIRLKLLGFILDTAIEREDIPLVRRAIKLGARVMPSHITTAITGVTSEMADVNGWLACAEPRVGHRQGDPEQLGGLMRELLIHLECGADRRCKICLSNGHFLCRQPERGFAYPYDVWLESANKCVDCLVRRQANRPEGCPFADSASGEPHANNNQTVEARRGTANTERMQRCLEIQKYAILKPRPDWGWRLKVTLSTNEPIRLTEGAQRLALWLQRMDRKLFPKLEWHKVPFSDRPDVFLVPEHGIIRGALHYHGVISLSADKEERFQQVVSKAWRKTFPMGCVDVQPVEDVEAWLRYCLTEKTEQGIGRTITRHADEFLVGQMLRG